MKGSSTIKILAVGNSFSQDATHYLSQIAEADGLSFKTANLYIGGCSLKRHCENMETGARDYLLELDGSSTGTCVSIQEALNMESWDYIVTQQASPDSGLPETYSPYLETLSACFRSSVPGAEILLQETWAYETDSIHPAFGIYRHSQQEMYERLRDAYTQAAQKNGLRLIPCGDAVQALRARKPFNYGHGGMSICRDGFHMNIIYGRYLLSAVWYRAITGRSLKSNTYVPRTLMAPNAICDPDIISVIKETVDDLIKESLV